VTYLIPLLIYLAVPALGLWAYSRLARWIADAGEPTWVGLVYFALFFCWGGVLVVLLTELLWAWSGMASLGMLFLAFVAGPACLFLTLWLFRQRRFSPWRAGAFWGSASFAGLWLAFAIPFTLRAI
jgi:type IV secretory pathway VirB3-like protein